MMLGLSEWLGGGGGGKSDREREVRGGGISLALDKEAREKDVVNDFLLLLLLLIFFNFVMGGSCSGVGAF